MVSYVPFAKCEEPYTISEENLLPLQVGDIIKRQNVFHRNYRELDSVINVVRTEDSIKIDFLVITLDTMAPGHPDNRKPDKFIKNKKFAIKELIGFFNAPTGVLNGFLDILYPPGTIQTISGSPKYIIYKFSNEYRTHCGDTSIVTSIRPMRMSIDTMSGDTSFSDLIDIAATYVLDSYLGKISQYGEVPYGEMMFPDSINVVGYRISCETWGDINTDFTELSVKNDKEDNNNPIFPNPTRDFINTAAYLGWQYQIYDLLGSCVQSGMIDAENISVASLPTGFYTVRFFKEGKQVVEKLMKE